MLNDCNHIISNSLKQRGVEISGFSSHRDDLKNFSEKNTQYWIKELQVNQKLFSFLLGNFMNRYLFNLMMKNSPNIESWAINDVNLSENNLKTYTFGQSFIRLYKCYDCKNLLKRIYAPELSEIPRGEIAECPNCGLKKMINPKDYESNFRIIRNDLTKFIENLRNIGVLHSIEYIVCSNCGIELGNKDELSGLTVCSYCRGQIKYKRRDEFKDDFLRICQSEAGIWFEWFIYEIVKCMYQNVEFGLILSYIDDEGNNKEKEVDIVALNGDKLTLIECKNYIGHTPPDQYRTIIDIEQIFDEIFIVNFYKPHKDYKKIIGNLDIKVLEGKDIDNVFLGNDLIISQLSSEDIWLRTQTIATLSKDKKISLIEQIFDQFQDRNNIRKALIKLIDSGIISSNIWWTTFSEKLKDTLYSELGLISKVEQSKADITDSLQLVASYYGNFDKEKLSSIINPVQTLNLIKGINKLATNYDSQIRIIYARLFNLYNINDFNLSDLSVIKTDILFDQIFDDLYYSYFENYNWRDRISTLSWLKFIFEKIGNTKVDLFSQLIEKEFYRSDFHSGDVADWMFNIFSNYVHKFGASEKLKICNSAKYLQKNGINDFVKRSALNFLDKCNEQAVPKQFDIVQI